MASANISFITIFLFSIFCVAVRAQTIIPVLGASVNVPEGCEVHQTDDVFQNNQSFCQKKTDSYPQELIDNYVEVWTKDKLELQDGEDFEMPDDYEHVDPECDYQKNKNCCSVTKVVQPTIAATATMPKLIIQSKFLKQTFKVTYCARSDGDDECFSDLYLSPKAKCKTNYGSINLFVLNPENNQIEFLPFTFPVSCSCDISSFE